MSEDMSQFMGVFLDEAVEQLEILEQDILILEQDASAHLLQEIFRAAHTLKGSSRAMGFAALGELTHAMEDVFDELRHGSAAVCHEMIDALFAGLDLIKAMKDELYRRGSISLEASEHTAALRASIPGDEQAAGGR